MPFLKWACLAKSENANVHDKVQESAVEEWTDTCIDTIAPLTVNIFYPVFDIQL